jgi:hypothetical protein
MSVAYFILVVTAISFATGLFVAFIIWVIKWSIISRENHETSGVKGFSQFLADLSSVRNKSEQLALSGNSMVNKELYQFYHGIPFLSRIFSGSDGNKTGNDSSNKELYRYYHGSATQEKTEDLKPKSSTGNNYLNKELYNYYHGEN